MDWIVVRLQLLPLLQRNLIEEVSDLVRVPRVEDVPESTDQYPGRPDTLSGCIVTASFINGPDTGLEVFLLVTVLGHPDIHDQVHSVAHVQVEVGGPILWIQRATIGDVHLGPEIRSHKELWHIGGQVIPAFSAGVIRQRNLFHKVREPAREVLGKVIFRRPVLQFQQHRHPVLIQHPGIQMLKPIPKEFQGNLRN